ncbi:MAG: Amino acid transporter [Clostridia bacterium]|jgi:polar amino acid transport system substrate-binding protein|nr:Amino acid transporter [Clostridia bacterium]
MKKLMTILLAASLSFAFAACAPEAKQETAAEQQPAAQSAEAPTAEAPQKITIGVDDTYPPMEYRDENNELVGFDIDFATALGEEMGVEIEFVSTAWDGIFTGLTTDKYDCIISSVSITPERLESYEFSKPYLSNGQVIVVKKGDASIASAADLGGKKVGVQLETTADIASQKQMEATPFELSQYDDIIQTFADLKTGRLDCIVVDYAVAIEYCAKNPEDYEITTAQLTNEPIAVCIKKGNTELKDKVNGAITALQEKGTMLSISDKWLGGDYVSNIDEELR